MFLNFSTYLKYALLVGVLYYCQLTAILYAKTATQQTEQNINELLVHAVAIVLEANEQQNMAAEVKGIKNFSTDNVKSELNDKLKLGISITKENKQIKAKAVGAGNTTSRPKYDQNKVLADKMINLINEIASYQIIKGKDYAEIKKEVKNKLLKDYKIESSILDNDPIFKSDVAQSPPEAPVSGDNGVDLKECKNELDKLKKELKKMNDAKANFKFNPTEILKQLPWYLWLAISLLLLVVFFTGFWLRSVVKKKNVATNNGRNLPDKNRNADELERLGNEIKEKANQIKQLEQKLQTLEQKLQTPPTPPVKDTPPLPEPIDKFVLHYAYLYSATHGFYAEPGPSIESMFEIREYDSSPQGGEITLKSDLSQATLSYIVSVYHLYEYAFSYKKSPLSGETHIKVLKPGRVYFDSSTGYWKIEGNNKIEVEFY